MSTDQEVLEKIKIEDEIGKYVSLKKRGRNYLGLCPFHNEKTPSFTVSPAKKIYKCFGCGRGGNIVSFIQELKQVSTNDALKLLRGELKVENKSNEGEFELAETPINLLVFNNVRDKFYSDVQSVRELMNFDSVILDFCIDHIESLDKKIKNNNEIKITNVVFYPENTLKQLKLIKKNNSFRNMYDSIFNQSLVLLVSYFTVAIKNLFASSLQYYAEHNKDHFKTIKTDLKFSIQELSNFNFNLSSDFGNLIISKNNITFQDMKSICREFKQYFGFNIEKNLDVDNIILSQASRHSIVHALSIADEKFINQIRSADKRSLKLNINQNDEIIFSASEIEVVIASMNKFLNNLFDNLDTE